MPARDYERQTVLITGASSGIGAAFARRLAARGSGLVLVARRRDRLESLAAELERAHGVTVHAIAQDLGSVTAGVDLSSAVAAADLRITGVINNAGFGTFGDFVGEDPVRLAQEIAVDISAPVQITAAFLPGMVEAGEGFLINVASMAAYAPTPRMAVYGAAKAFVLSFTESLWAETHSTGVTVFALSPGATSTEFNAVVGTDDATAGARMRTPDDVVATASGPSKPRPQCDRWLVQSARCECRPCDESARSRRDDASPHRPGTPQAPRCRARGRGCHDLG